jgi:uncharacterized protein (TIGR03086 family)
MSKNLRNFTSALYGFDAVVRRMPADAWDQASGCEGWSGRDVLQHQCAVMNGVEALARTGQMAAPSAPDDVSDPVATWNACRQQLTETLDQPGVLQQAGPFWFDTPTIDDTIGFVQWDLLGHTWDLAQAGNLEAPLDEEAASAALEQVLAMQPMLIESGRIGQPVDVPADASVGDRYLGAIGRNPAG